MPKFAVKMSWLDTYVQVIEAPTEAEAIQEAHNVGDWGEPKWGGDEQATWAEEINDQQSHCQQRFTFEDTDTVDGERLLGATAPRHR